MSFTITKQIRKSNFYYRKTSTQQKVLISYKTIVGWFNFTDRIWELTTQKYSRTTSKQLTMFARENTCIWVDELPESITIHNG